MSLTQSESRLSPSRGARSAVSKFKEKKGNANKAYRTAIAE